MIDLHSHTTYSDGHSSVKELLIEAQNINLSTLSITDHNTVDAYKEIKQERIRNLYSGIIISGIELTTTYNGEIIELLGYNFDIDKMNELLKGKVDSFEEKQLKEYELIKNRYQEIGIKMNLDNVIFDPKKESSRIAFCNEIKKYSENHDFFLTNEALTTDRGFTRNEVFNPKSPLYVDQTSLFPTLEEVIDIIHQANGLAFLAHTFAYSKNISDKLEDIIKDYNLDGLECYYTTFTKEQTEYLIDMCDKHNLFKSGGSDYHGTNKVNHELGIGNGSLAIDKDLISDWFN